MANRFGGTYRATTGIKSSRFSLRASVSGIRVEATGTSEPYGLQGGTTEIHAFAKVSLHANVYLAARYSGAVSMWRRFAMRDVIIGDQKFDDMWIINAKREAQAQAFLDAKTRELVEAVPASQNPAGYGGSRGSFYRFKVQGRIVRANTANFETSEDRFAAAIAAAVALAKRPEQLLDDWKSVASQLEGRLEVSKRWKMDGSTRIQFPTRGRRVTVSPRAIRRGYRRDRLVTRVYCECSGTSGDSFRFRAGESTDAFGEAAGLIASAMNESGALVLESDGKVVSADLDGNVTDARRIIAAANAVATLARDDSAVGPYR